MQRKDSLSWLYPVPEPHDSGFLRVSDLHTLYWEESGNPRGKPVVFVHGGPGDGTNPQYRRFFDPQRYRIVLFDQRGCARALPMPFFDADDQLLRDVPRIRDIPATIVQGRYDLVCPMRSAWDLHRAWPEAEFMIVPDAGHSALEAGISRALVAATDRYAG